MKTKLFLLFAVVVMAVLGAQTASAGVIPLTNAGFEAADLFPAADRVAGWTNDTGSTAAPITALPLSGLQPLQMWGTVGIRQDTGHAVLASQTYSLTINARKFPSDPEGVNLIQLFAGDPFGGGIYLNELNLGALTTSYQAFTVEYTTPASGAMIGQNLWVRLRHENSGFVLMDDVSASVTPEPATLALLGLGGLILRRRRS